MSVPVQTKVNRQFFFMTILVRESSRLILRFAIATAEMLAKAIRMFACVFFAELQLMLILGFCFELYNNDSRQMKRIVIGIQIVEFIFHRDCFPNFLSVLFSRESIDRG